MPSHFSSAEQSPPLDPLRILIVEDSPTQALRLRHALEKRKCVVQTAGDGARALELLEAGQAAGLEPPDAIISDVLMPRMGGYELCRRLKGDPLRASIPVILLTTLGDPADLLRGLESGADSFAVKPCEADALLMQISRLKRDRQPSLALSPAGEESGAGTGDFLFDGQNYRISAGAPQILRFLIAAYEEARHRTERLEETNRELRAAHEELEGRRAELEQLNTTKNQLLGMAAHDLRNPLDVVRGYAEILAEDVSDRLDEEELRMLGHIRSSSDYMLAIVNDLLDVTRIEAGTLELHCEPTEPVEFVQRTLSTLKVFAERKNIDLVLESDSDLPLILIDLSKADQVLNNLVGNALKFSPFGTRVTVSVHRVPAPPDALSREDWVELAVRDNGPGIPPEELEHIFKPFRRAGAKPTAGESSTGLGLAIVHKIVDCHGGLISVESQLGSGSRFQVRLPPATV